jgi:hypothetical protein
LKPPCISFILSVPMIRVGDIHGRLNTPEDLRLIGKTP